MVPEERLTSKDRRAAEKRVEELRDSGDPIALGKAYLRLAHIYKHFGPGKEGVHPFVASANAAEVAVQLLKDTPDRTSYARALRASIVAFTSDGIPEARARLEQALAISEESGDLGETGWSHFALGNHAMRTGDGKMARKHEKLAQECFLASGDDELIGYALFSAALKEDKSWQDYEKAATHYEAAECWRNAAVAYNLASLEAAHFKENKAIIRRLARKQVHCAQRSGDKLLTRGGKRMLRIHK